MNKVFTTGFSVGSLVIIGTGMELGGHLTAAALGWIKSADRVFFVTNEAASAHWLRSLNPSAKDLRDPFGDQDTTRYDVYQQMATNIVAPLDEGKTVVAAFCGHPGMLTGPAHMAREMALAAGHSARILPGISAEDTLFAELGIDPGETGWQSFDATDFLIHNRRFDPNSVLVLYQPAMVGAPGYQIYDARCLPVLREALLKTYPPTQEIIIYEASPYAICQSDLKRVSLLKLERSDLSQNSLICILPSQHATPDVVMLAKLARASADFEADVQIKPETEN